MFSGCTCAQTTRQICLPGSCGVIRKDSSEKCEAPTFQQSGEQLTDILTTHQITLEQDIKMPLLPNMEPFQVNHLR